MSMQISLTGLEVAQRGLDLIGANLSNAATEGYHRQELRIAPIAHEGATSVTLGGAEVIGARRFVDGLLEREMLRQQCRLGQVSQELTTLELVERTLGDIDTSRLGNALNDFFNSLTELAGHPRDLGYQQAAIQAGQALGEEFRSFSSFMQDLLEQVALQARTTVGQINELTSEIAKLNLEINAALLRGMDPNVLKDRRDQMIMELGELAEIEIDERGGEPGFVNVRTSGTTVVLGGQSSELAANTGAESALNVTVEGSTTPLTGINSGKLGALLALNNDLLCGVMDRVDLLAGQIIESVNRVHAQGVGKYGSFARLDGEQVGLADTALADLGENIETGALQVRITDEQTGEVSVHLVSVDDLDATFADFADDLDGIDHLSAWVGDAALHLQADTGYAFDFLPVSSPEYDPSDWDPVSNTAEVGVAGALQEGPNEDYTVSVVGGGSVGIDEGLSLRVETEGGEQVTQFNVGLGYTPGDDLALTNGVRLRLGPGELTAGDSFTLHCAWDSDGTGLLAATKLNTFFCGTDASDMAVSETIASDPERIATASGASKTDNRNIVRMADIYEEQLPGLGDVTPAEYYRETVTAIGRDVAFRDARKTAVTNVAHQLTSQRDELSGVNVNEEAAKMVLFQQMFQACAKILSVQNQVLQSLMEAI